MIKAESVKSRVSALLVDGASLEDVLYTVTQENLVNLPEHLQDDPQEISTVLAAVQFYARAVHPEFESASAAHDLALRRLLPKMKTDRYIEQLNDEA